MIKPQIKVILSMLIAIIVYPLLQEMPISSYEPLFLGLLILKELMLGMATGMLALLMFVGVQIGGQILGFQMGFSMVNVVDPQSNVNMSIIGQIMNIIMILLFLSVGGHYIFLGGLVQSFKIIPLGQFSMQGDAHYFLVTMFSYAYYTAVKIVAPIMIVLITTHVVMGMLGRLVPQLNVMIVGFPIQISVGLFVFAASLNYFYIVFEKIMNKFFGDIASLFKLISGP